MAPAVGIVRDDAYLEHKPGIIHPESPNRLKFVYKMLDREFAGKVDYMKPSPATLSDLEAVHTPAYVEKVLKTANISFTHLAADTPAGPGTYLAAWLAAGGCVLGVDELLSGERHVCFSLSRPPGHHALPGRAGGFCVFNNLGVAARHAMRRYGLRRVLILDWDLHHGNALQDLFFEEREALYVSSHFTNIFPYGGEWEEVGVGAGKGYNVNLVLTKGIDDLDILSLYRWVLERCVRRYRPELIMVAAGFDLHHEDIFSRAAVTETAFGWLTRLVTRLAAEVGDPPILLSLEGGYRIPTLVNCVREALRALTIPDYPPWPSETSTETAEKLIAKVRSVHAPYGVWAD